MKMVLEISFLALSSAYIQFDTKKLIWRSYIIAETLSTTSWVEFIDKREFTKIVLDEIFEMFGIHVVALKAKISIYLIASSLNSCLIVE